MEERKGFGSNFGFLMASVGSAVGLGNIWGFPNKMGASGGFTFLVVYLVLAVLCGFIVMVGELALGRKTGKGVVSAYHVLSKRFKWLGWLGILSPFFILFFYCALGGYCIKYVVVNVGDLFGASFGSAAFAEVAAANGTSLGAEVFNAFMGNPTEAIIYGLIFVALTMLIVMGGVSGGIEKVCSVGMPALFVMLLICIIRACTLPGAEAGIEFLFQPSTENVMSSGGWLTVFGIALAQMFFSLNVGFGTNLMYGSYAPDDSDLAKNALLVPLGDMVVALLAALATIPAAFAFGYSPSAGAGMLFITMKAVFESMPGGAIFGFLFFVAVFFAAISSVIGMTAANAAIPCEHWGWSNKKGTLLALASNLIIAIPVSLGYSSLSGVRLLSWMGKDTDILDSIDYLCENCFATVAALALCIFVGWIWKPAAVIEEVEKGGKFKFTWKGIFTFLIRYICPIITLIVVLSSIGIISL